MGMHCAFDVVESTLYMCTHMHVKCHIQCACVAYVIASFGLHCSLWKPHHIGSCLLLFYSVVIPSTLRYLLPFLSLPLLGGHFWHTVQVPWNLNAMYMYIVESSRIFMSRLQYWSSIPIITSSCVVIGFCVYTCVTAWTPDQLYTSECNVYVPVEDLLV